MTTPTKKVAKEAGKYSILPEYIGLRVCTPVPQYEREQGGCFDLTDDLSQKDLGFLYEVIKYPGVIKN